MNYRSTISHNAELDGNFTKVYKNRMNANVALTENVDEVKDKINSFLIIPDDVFLEKEKKEYGDAALLVKDKFASILKTNEEAMGISLAEANKLFIEVRKLTYQFCEGKENILMLDRQKFSHLPSMAYELDIFCNNAFRVAIRLTNHIYDAIKHPFVSCKTVIEYEEFSIDINGRSMIKISALSRDEKRRYGDIPVRIVEPYSIDYDLPKILHLPPEIELILLLENAIYGDNPLAILRCEDDYIKFLFVTALDRYKKHINAVSAKDDKANDKADDKAKGGEADDKTKDDKADGDVISREVKHGGAILRNCKDANRDKLNQIKLLIVRDWLHEQVDTVILGSWAFMIIEKSRDKLCFSNDRIQFMSHKINADLFASIKKFIGQHFDYKISLSCESPIEIPNEHRLKRCSIKTEIDGHSYVIADLYSMLHYSAVTVQRCGQYFVLCKELLLKFMFIDLWVFLSAYKSQKISDERYIMFVENILNNTKKLLTTEFSVDFIIGFSTPYVEYHKFSMLEAEKHLPYVPHNKKMTI